MQSSASSVKIWTALSIVYVVWGSTYLAIRWSVETIPPLISAGSRFALAGVLLGVIVLAVKGKAAFRTGWPASRNGIICGLLVLGGGNGMLVLAETKVPSGLAALLVAAVPLWLVILRRASGSSVPVLTWVGVLIGLGGVGLLFARGSGGHTDLRYAALVVVASFSWSLGSFLATRIEVPAEPMVLSTYEMLAAGVVMSAVAGIRGEYGRLQLSEVSTKSWLSLVYLVVFGSLLAFSAYIWVFGNAPTSLVSTYAYVNPAVAVVLGVLLANESLTALELIGGAVILTAVVIVVRSEGRHRADRKTVNDTTPGDTAGSAPVGESCQPHPDGREASDIASPSR